MAGAAGHYMLTRSDGQPLAEAFLGSYRRPTPVSPGLGSAIPWSSRFDPRPLPLIHHDGNELVMAAIIRECNTFVTFSGCILWLLYHLSITMVL